MYLQFLDWSGAFFNFLATIFFIRASVLAWPISLMACSIDIFLYLQKGIYADSALTVIYLLSTFYGWYKWLYGGKNQTELPISILSTVLFIKLSLLALIATAVIFSLLHFYTDSQVPLWDAITTSLSLIAQWLTCRKILQNWQLWFVVDALYFAIYFYKGISMHALLQGAYLVMAVIGYLSWSNKYKTIRC